MVSIEVHLFQARDGGESFAIGLASDPRGTWRARTGFGQEFEQVWSLDLQSEVSPEVQTVDWDTVLERAVEAFRLSDPVITNFEWPNESREARQSG